jgi:hypothetical protein
LTLLGFVSVSPAQVTVQTIGGGVRTECGNSFGFAAGNTWTAAQFNQPYSTALDSQGNLWLADMNNSDIEEITQAGNRTSSLTYQYASGSNKHPFPNVIGVATDSSDNLYVLTTTTLLKFDDVTESFPDLNNLLNISLSAFSSGTPTAMAVVNDVNTNIYIAFSSGSGGSIIRIPQPYSGSYITVVGNYSFAPSGLSMREDGQLAVCDTLHDGIYLVSTNNGSTPVLLTGGLGAGFVNGTPSFAKFNQPHGIAASADGRMVVCDTMNNYLRLIDTSNNTTTLYGTASNVWTTTCCSCSPTLYAGWVDGTAGTTSASASGREPVSVTIAPNGTLFVTELFYNLIRSVTGSGLTPVTTINSVSSSTNLAAVTTQAATSISANGATLNATVDANGSPTTVYFQWGTNTAYGSNTASITLTTNLGSSNAISIPLTGLLVNTVIHFQVVAINNGGTAYGGDRSFITTTVSASSNQLGFATGVFAGIGSVAYVPIALQLQSGTQVESLQFLVEVTPNGGAPPLSTSLSLLPITPNDFVQLAGPAPGNAPVAFNVIPYTNTASSNGQGLLIYTLGPGSGLDIQNYGVVGLLRIPIPYSASTNQTYNLNILNPSGTSDGLQASVPMAPMAIQLLTVADLPYLAGDSSPANGYNAEQFGSGYLDNSDVNNAVYASMGVRVPPVDSDAFNAMDVYPQTAGVGGENGDGLLQYQDWNQILLRSVGLNPTNWIRFWTNGGFLVGVPTIAGLPADPIVFNNAVQAEVSSPPGLVWLCPASIGAGTVTNLVPGSTCSLPVYAKVRAGYSLGGFQFRAIVSANSNAPPVGQVQFNPTTGVPSPMTLPGLAPNDVLIAWALGDFTPPLQNSNYIGTITFQVPATATAGQSYAVHFTGVDGAPDGTTDYAMESFPGYAWVLSTALQPASITSDEWKLHFFGSLTSSLAGDNVDADSDGALNWQEYLAGTDPTNPLSVFCFGGTGFSSNGVSGVTLSWLTAPGKTYILQSIPAFGGGNWTAFNTNTGDGYTYQFIQNNDKGTAQFYRILLQP